MAKPFRILPYTNLDKRFEIEGPDSLRLFVDNDDVDQREVAKASKKMVRILNQNWGNDES